MLSHAHAGFLSEPVTPHERQPYDSLNYHTRGLLAGLRVPDPLALRSLLRSGRLKEAKAGAFLGLPKLHSTFYFDRTTLLDIRRLVLPNAPPLPSESPGPQLTCLSGSFRQTSTLKSGALRFFNPSRPRGLVEHALSGQSGQTADPLSCSSTCLNSETGVGVFPRLRCVFDD